METTKHLEAINAAKKFCISKQQYSLATKLRDVEKEMEKLYIKEWTETVLNDAQTQSDTTPPSYTPPAKDSL